MPRRVPTHRPPWMPPPGGPDRHRDYNRNRRDKGLLKLYSTAAWQKFRAMIRRDRIFCEKCQAEGRPHVPGEHVHHVRDPREYPAGAFDPANVELWCKSCHSAHHAALRGATNHGRDHV